VFADKRHRKKTLMNETHLNILICWIFYSINKYRSSSYIITKVFH